MQYWNSLLTEKSWEKLLELRRTGLRFILIGGWACFLWTKSHKSKDVDIIVDMQELTALRQRYTLKKNTRLKKYEFSVDEIDFDVYVPFYSKLALPIEKIMDSTASIEGFSVMRPEPLLLLKQGAELARRDSSKGLKDRIDIMDLLLKSPFNFQKYNSLVKNFGLEKFRARLIELVQGFRENEYLGMNPRELKKAKQKILHKLKSAEFS